MGKVISFMNMKGGVCKTTLCVNIANTLATHFKEKVLLIDMDPQFNASQYILSITENDYMNKYKDYKEDRKTIYYLYNDNGRQVEQDSHSISNVGALFNSNNLEEPYLKDDYIINIKENFDMILGDIDLIELQITQKEGITKRLDKYIKHKKLRDVYKYILIDCAPTYSFYFISAYSASDTYIIPLKPDYVASLGLSLLEKAISSIETDQDRINSCGVIYTLIDSRNNLHEPVIDDIESSIGKNNIFDEKLRYLVDIPRGVGENKFMLDIHNNGIDDSIKSITEEFIGRIGENQDDKG
ncbi:ParA family protein [Intestinibacter bartlettii]|jgi:chromosome partitioning protein|uniref:ParA family protein n=1 Tax=Intestinibacter bartlettii TaxID=261299 RepID=UPI0029028662|nr:ParA family protein [Intestinibacter bartlettii]MDU2163295.1 ParA family protein [Intestinibacter bartlettii]MDU4257565.1 ParA family protein [Intestinibacter bartlettii]